MQLTSGKSKKQNLSNVTIFSVIITISLFVLQVVSQNYAEKKLIRVISAEGFSSKNDIAVLLGLFEDNKVISTDGSSYRQAYLQLKNGEFKNVEVGQVRNFEDYKKIVSSDLELFKNSNQQVSENDRAVFWLNMIQCFLFFCTNIYASK
jgi:hypothetical protein